MCIQIGDKKVGKIHCGFNFFLYLCIVIERGFNHKGKGDTLEYGLRPTLMSNC